LLAKALFNIIARRTLLAYCRLYPVAAVALQQWYAELLNQDFANFNELKQVYAAASLVGDDRVVFNIMGNKYRLVVRMVFAYKAVQIKWFGTHREHDTINVATVQFRDL
jgi:mRNA interferase HigB